MKKNPTQDAGPQPNFGKGEFAAIGSYTPSPKTGLPDIRGNHGHNGTLDVAKLKLPGDKKE